MKYCKREERRVKEEYRQMKRRITMRVKGNKTKERNVKRLLQSIAQTTQDRWSKGMEKNRSRVSWWKSKLVSQKRKQTKLTTRQSWIERVARGRERIREKVQIPVYGDLKFTNSEMDALSLPPKHAEYERVTKDKTRHQMRVTQTKTRYGWKSLL